MAPNDTEMASTRPLATRLDADGAGDDVSHLDGEKKRSHKARTEEMVVIPHVDPDGYCIGMYDVLSASGSVYTVDLENQHACECPDEQYNRPEEGCKHRKAVALRIQETPLPAPDDDAAAYFDALGEMLSRLQRRRARLLDQIDVLNSFIDGIEEAV